MAEDLGAFIAMPGVVYVDVRTPEEFSEGAVDGSINLPVDQLAPNLEGLPADKSTPIITFCAHGRRGGIAADFFKAQGYTTVINGVAWHSVKAAVADYHSSK